VSRGSNSVVPRGKWKSQESPDAVKHRVHIASGVPESEVKSGECVGLAHGLPAPEGIRYRTIRGIILVCVVYGLISVH
jgi:hypothetical protein